MDKAMQSLYQELSREAQEYRVSIFKLARIKRKMESGKNDFSKIIPLLIREIEAHIRRSMRGEEEKRVALVSLNLKRNQFLELQKEVIYRGK